MITAKLEGGKRIFLPSDRLSPEERQKISAKVLSQSFKPPTPPDEKQTGTSVKFPVFCKSCEQALVAERGEICASCQRKKKNAEKVKSHLPLMLAIGIVVILVLPWVFTHC